ncbi:MAG: CHC2 zinc finger domain-containing protein [Actinomycetes bacterium]
MNPGRLGARRRVPSPIAAARARHSLAEVAARTGVDPYRASGSISVRCPLPSHRHPDRTPSLRLHLGDGLFFCFGCGAKGDVVEWVRQAEGVDWREAIAILDDRRPLTNAWAYYTYPPLRHRGQEYLKTRGIDVEVLQAHTGRAEVGHTPAMATGLITALRSTGFSDDELVDAGLAHRRQGGGPHSDFYRQRVLIPIRDDQERVVGLIGRNVGDQQRFAKYTNPPRTHAYDKPVNLYQPLPAPGDPHGQVVVVEDTLDAIAIAVTAIHAGRPAQFCPITQSGRELSAVQLAYVLGLHPAPPVLGFDADPNDHDPASWLAEHADEGLSAWVRDGAPRGKHEAPRPVAAATFASHYVEEAIGRRERSTDPTGPGPVLATEVIGP